VKIVLQLEEQKIDFTLPSLNCPIRIDQFAVLGFLTTKERPMKGKRIKEEQIKKELRLPEDEKRSMTGDRCAS